MTSATGPALTSPTSSTRPPRTTDATLPVSAGSPGADNVRGLAEHHQFDTVALPAIGCGLGGPQPTDVLATILPILEPSEAHFIMLLADQRSLGVQLSRQSRES